MPEVFKPVGPGIDGDAALASIATALHMSSGPIVGQNIKKV